MVIVHFFYVLWCIQVILESLPISSSGHIVLLNAYMKNISITKTIDHVMHIPTMAVLFAFLVEQWWYLIRDLPNSGAPLYALCLAVVVADSITGLLYGLFKLIDKAKFPLWAGFSITACLLLSLYALVPGSTTTISIGHACLVGVIQGLALLPGISRLGATVAVGCWLGLSPVTALTFSCALQFPLLLAAATKAVYDILYRGAFFYSMTTLAFVALAASSCLAYVLLWWLAYLLEHNAFVLFGWYMIIPTVYALSSKLIRKTGGVCNRDGSWA
jgi:undecaprenyl-diphosphatase